MTVIKRSIITPRGALDANYQKIYHVGECNYHKLPLIGNTLKRVVPVANYHGILPLNTQQHLEWSLLDTFDWLSPEHDHPQTSKTIRQWMDDADIRDIEILKAGHLVSRGKK